MNVSSLLQWLSENASLLICVLAGLHFILFLSLRRQWSSDLEKLQDFLESLLRNIPGTSDLRRASDLEDQISDFLQDVRAILGQDHFQDERAKIFTRVVAKKEQRPYLKAKGFERGYSVFRAVVEIYPLAGILGTILAMGVSLTPAPTVEVPDAGSGQTTINENLADNTPTESAELDVASSEETAVAGIVANFRSAIWSTFFGLFFAIVFMGINAWHEPSFTRLVEYRKAVRDAVREAERGMVLAEAEGGGP